MWIFSGFGYFSVIEHRKDRDLLLVRSRVRGDLEKLKEKCLPNLGEIVETPTGADYPYRALAWRIEFAEAMKKAVEQIDYTNFKSGISRTQGGPRHDLYMRVWSVMKDAEPTMRRIEREDAERAKNPPKQYTTTSWVGYDDFRDRDDGRFGGTGSKSTKSGNYQCSLDLNGSRKARDKRLRDQGLHEKMTKDEIDEARKARQRVEKLVATQLKGTVNDFDKDFEDETDTPPSNWIDSAEKFLQEQTDQDQIDPTIDRDKE